MEREGEPYLGVGTMSGVRVASVLRGHVDIFGAYGRSVMEEEEDKDGETNSERKAGFIGVLFESHDRTLCLKEGRKSPADPPTLSP